MASSNTGPRSCGRGTFSHRRGAQPSRRRSGAEPARTANPASADKTKDRLSGDRGSDKARSTLQESARAGPLESRPHARSRRAVGDDEDRLFDQTRAMLAAKRSTQRPERTAAAPRLLRPANDDRHPRAKFCARFRPATSGVPTALRRGLFGLWVILVLGYLIANRRVIFELPAGSLLPEAHSTS